jgi:hypothetical protein
MIEIDGSMLEGGGRILRTSVALSALVGKPVKVTKIRAKRDNPGLQAQHIAAVEAVEKLVDAEVIGLQKGSSTVEFHPKQIRGGLFKINVGTTGSVEQNRIKRIELYFDPRKTTGEALFYMELLRKLGLRGYAVRIYYPQNDSRRRNEAIRLAKELRRIFMNVKILPKSKIFGLGGTIFIHSKEDIRRLSPYNLFYPNISYNKTFYRLWK